MTLRLLRHILMLLCLVLSLFTSCQSHEAEVPDAARSVYYWRQELSLNASERAWMERHEVSKVYLHLFDVVRQGGNLQPRGTLTVTDALPAGTQVVPVVFLAHDIMRDTTGIAQLPQLLARRVSTFMQQNGMGQWGELQVDFDWARSNQTRYFALLTQLREELAHQCGHSIRLSATIRLHQLQMKVPPVDYGSLMVYNVGHIQAEDEECSILTADEVRPYLRHLRGYDLPLTVALPVYSWDLLFHDHRFRCILRGVDITDTASFERIDPTHYRALRYQPIPPGGVSMRGDGRIYPGDIIRHEYVTPEVLHDVRRQLMQQRPSALGQTILYHLDSKQLNQYSDEDIQTLYSGR